MRVNLDERGSAFWGLIDGETELNEIERQLRQKFSLSREDSELAAVQFTKRLMKRYLIYLKVPAEREQ